MKQLHWGDMNFEKQTRGREEILWAQFSYIKRTADYSIFQSVLCSGKFELWYRNMLVQEGGSVNARYIHIQAFCHISQTSIFSSIQIPDALPVRYIPKTLFIFSKQLWHLSINPIAYNSLHQQGIKMAYGFWVCIAWSWRILITTVVRKC